MSLFELPFHMIKIMEGILGTFADFPTLLLDLVIHPSRVRFMNPQFIMKPQPPILCCQMRIKTGVRQGFKF